MIQHYLQAFEESKDDCLLPPDQQAHATQWLATHGLPTTKNEVWRSSARHAILQKKFSMLPEKAAASTLKKISLPKASKDRLRVFFFKGQLLLPAKEAYPQGLHLSSNTLIQGMEEANSVRIGQAFYVLNTLFSRHGLHLVVEDNTHIEPIIELCYVFTDTVNPQMICLQNRFSVGRNSSVQVVERSLNISETEAQTHKTLCFNVLNTLTLDQDARVNWGQSLQLSDANAYMGHWNIQQHKNSQLAATALTLGGGLIRNTVFCDLREAHASCDFKGFTWVKKRQQADAQLFVRHGANDTLSHLHYRAVADHQSKAIFGGEVIAAENIRGMRSEQNSHNLLLADGAEVITRPRLVLASDEIECSHGATVGALDKVALFYLQSRGILPKKAQTMLVHAFGETLFQQMPLLAKGINFGAELDPFVS